MITEKVRSIANLRKKQSNSLKHNETVMGVKHRETNKQTNAAKNIWVLSVFKGKNIINQGSFVNNKFCVCVFATP